MADEGITPDFEEKMDAFLRFLNGDRQSEAEIRRKTLDEAYELGDFMASIAKAFYDSYRSKGFNDEWAGQYTGLHLARFLGHGG